MVMYMCRRRRWVRVAMALVVLMCVFAFASNAGALSGPDSFPNSAIADHAEAVPDGTWEGQCIVFVEKMIVQAGGPSLAFGYNTDTYQAQWAQHAVQVPDIAQALPGDVIQWGGGAGGSELHTAIVTSAGSDSGVIDSNFGYPLNNELVHRGDFNSRNLSGDYRIWRLGQVSSPPPPPRPDPSWIGDFTRSGHSQVLFYSPSDQHWWLGNYWGSSLHWRLISSTSGFGNTGGDPTWIGDFTHSGHSQVLFYSPADQNWWLGSYSRGSLGWRRVGITSGFGNTAGDPTWIGDFTRSGHSQVLFYSPSDQHWWLGNYWGSSLHWRLISSTSGFGNTGGDPTWIGDFTHSGHSQVLFTHRRTRTGGSGATRAGRWAGGGSASPAGSVIQRGTRRGLVISRGRGIRRCCSTHRATSIGG